MNDVMTGSQKHISLLMRRISRAKQSLDRHEKEKSRLERAVGHENQAIRKLWRKVRYYEEILIKVEAENEKSV